MTEGVISFGAKNVFSLSQRDYSRAPDEIKNWMISLGFLPERLIYENVLVGSIPATIIIEDERWIALIKKGSVSIFTRLFYTMNRAKRVIGRTYAATCFLWVRGRFFRTFSRVRIKVHLK